ncbi:acyltransferase [Clostridium cochlearium]|uniref:acyltransferase n=1 Tax=Clostridium cochlearium TaxID=1494 RepID=UPI001EDCEF89|nr:acyltransferase [Clostridium cochlearium]MBV1819361.1 acyltransferase [Bacteroidales bacterium MSK.15.36]MCG4572189.1 acyltransferase [Clostridium cochlearium]MCG4580204.1 acyltransferase [Clostridium cochlearium]
MEKRRRVKREKILEMDMLRAICALAVVIIHTSGYTLINSVEGSVSYNVSLSLNQIARFSVPLFLFLSGLGLGISYKKDESYFKFLRKRVFKIIPPYILWGSLYLILIQKNYDYKTWGELFLKGDKVFYHLYYIPLIMTLYIIFPILYPLFKRIEGVIISLLISLGVTYFAHYYNVPDLTLDIFSKRNAIFWNVYFISGVYISREVNNLIRRTKTHKVKIMVILIICAICLIGESFIGLKTGKSLDYSTTFIKPSVMIYSYIVMLYVFSKTYNKKSILVKILGEISKSSFSIYLIHPMVLYYYMKIFSKNNLNMGTLWFLVSSILVSGGIPYLLWKVKHLFNKL